MERDLILKYIQLDEDEYSRRRRMFDYYNEKQDILKREQKDASKPNNRIAHSYPRMIANAYNGYMFGKPVTYSAQDEELNQRIQDTFKYNDEEAQNSSIGLDMGICGVGVEVHYTDANGMDRFCAVDPVGCIDVRDDTIENNLVALIRYYDVLDVADGKTTRMVEVLDDKFRELYRQDGSELIQVSRTEHGYQDVPAVIWENNKFRTGDFEPVMTEIDAYNIMQSESLNDQQYFTDALLALKGLEGTTPEGIAEMKEERVLLLPVDSDASWLIKQQSDQLPENIKNRLNEDIHKFSGCPDMGDDSFAGNASGVALKYKLLGFEINASAKQRGIKKALQRRIELLCNIWSVKGAGKWDWRDVQISFKRALPENLLEISQMLSNFGNLLSDETKRSMIPMDLDEETEKQRLEEQSRLGLDLFSASERMLGELEPDAGNNNPDPAEGDGMNGE